MTEKDKALKSKLPCPCGKSSDAYSEYPDHGYCYGQCGGRYFNHNSEFNMDFPVDENYTYEYVARRGISKGVHEFFGAKAKINGDGKPISIEYPHPSGAKQIKSLLSKNFYWVGTPQAGCFGSDKFPAGSAKAITITEGMDDAMSVTEMMGKYPVVSIRGASSAIADVRADYDFINSFDKIYLCLDNDEPGKKAAQEIASIFGFNKVYHVKNAPYKDATDFAEAGKTAEFRNTWFNADRYLPEGIVSSFARLREIFNNRKKFPRWETPFSKLNYLLGGGFEIHRSYLISGLTGIGKTEFFRACQHKLYKDRPDDNIAILHFEEPIDETIQRAAGYELETPAHLPESHVSDETVLQTFEKLVGREDRVHFVQHYGSEQPDVILNKIRFLVAACGCKFVFLDNITVLGTGRVQDDERKELDYLSTQLEMLVKELPFCLIFISHENEQEGTRGSQNINKVVDVWVNLKRDVENPSDFIQCVMHFLFKKNRQASRTGPAGKAFYNRETGVLSELTEDLPT